MAIADFANAIRKVVGYEGDLDFDTSRPDGTPRKLLDVALLNGLGWKAQTPLAEGLARYYQWFLENREQLRCE
jgi:GDP-L-fucose synthase